jgi:glycosyltransferase involved in cell wall biosynthesis
MLAPNNYPASFGSEVNTELSSADVTYTFVYVGSFGHWNKPDLYLEFLKRINEISPNPCTMLFIVRGAAVSEIESEAKRKGVDPNLFDIESVHQKEVASYLSRCCFGLYFMEYTDPRLGVKTAEYLSVGLPVIVSENILGAADLVTNNDLGNTWDHSEVGLINIYKWMQEVATDRALYANRCRDFARSNLSPEVVARQLLRAYEEIAVE